MLTVKIANQVRSLGLILYIVDSNMKKKIKIKIEKKII